ncbi:WD40 repeat [Dillenia turbinata]|uniref:WD40 repeat n=1 Tax=Dillenia turbinata TaxID=194707 RepID=A0AAN8ZRD6_9MAGN
MAKTPIGCEAVVGSLTPSKKKEYKVTNRLQEGKRPLYAVVFNFIDSRFFNVFATVGGNRVTVYQCLEGGVIAVLQSYIDEDFHYKMSLVHPLMTFGTSMYFINQKDESFYTLSWACTDDATPFIVAGGINGIIRVIDSGSEKIHKSLVGHGDSINEIRTQALRPSLVVSASKDESVRLWNVQTGICILIFAGAGGHRNEVLSVDFHPSDIYRIASCGMDNTVKIWSMKEFWTYVEKSFTWTDLPSKFPTKYVQFPVFIASVHSNYVDCNRWLGDFIVSKSVDNELVLWEPKMKEQSPGEGSVDILQKYPVPECDIWFIKFSCDFHYNYAAVGNDNKEMKCCFASCITYGISLKYLPRFYPSNVAILTGNREGKIYVWELQACPPVLVARLSHAHSKSPIRQTAMSFDGSIILSCCEDGTIWRWDAMTAASSS